MERPRRRAVTETFRIRVEDTHGEGYSVRLVSGAAGPADSGPVAVIPADLDAAQAPLDNGEGDVMAALLEFVAENDESPKFDDWGAYLGALLLRDEVAVQWDALPRGHEHQLHVLLDIQSQALRALPWELIVRDEDRLFLDENAVFSRVHDLRNDTDQELVPLRLLVVDGPQDDGDELGAAEEIRGIKSALPAFRGRVDAEFLHQPSKEDLGKAFERVRPHIFHFIGHGLIGAGGEPALRIGGWSLTRRFVRDTLSHIPRVVVLNACRSGDAAPAGSLTADHIRALTDTFLAKGSAAAIGMQGDVRGRAAAQFGAGLYRGLADGLLLDQAVAHGRRSMVAGGGNEQARDWFLPSLTLAVVPDQVLALAHGIPKDEQTQVESELFGRIGLFVDRSPIRWDLAAAVDPDDGELARTRLVRILGGPDAGKTWLVNWIRTRCAFRGRRVRYVAFSSKGVLDFVRALEFIRDAPEDIASLAPAVGAFDRFTWDLAHLVNGRIPPEEIVGEPPEIPDRLQLGGENEERIFESFRAALEEATTDTPLLLILDQLDGVLSSDFQTRIFHHFVEPVVRGNPPNVSLVVVLSSEQQRTHWPSDAGEIGTKVEVALLSLEEYRACAEDVVLAMGQEFTEDHAGIIQGVVGIRQPPLSPALLGMLAQLVGGD